MSLITIFLLFAGHHPNMALVCPARCTGRLISTWFTLMNFRKLFNVPMISLEALDIMLSNAGTVHPAVRQMHIALLTMIVKARVAQGTPLPKPLPPKPPLIAPLKLNVGTGQVRRFLCHPHLILLTQQPTHRATRMRTSTRSRIWEDSLMCTISLAILLVSGTWVILLSYRRLSNLSYLLPS